uniref:Uncharacterized protein n=1 Tax=Cacopsylla melanoneura TaxID=428564 RepID=A0A8D8S1C3_9HEMI
MRSTMCRGAGRLPRETAACKVIVDRLYRGRLIRRGEQAGEPGGCPRHCRSYSDWGSTFTKRATPEGSKPGSQKDDPCDTGHKERGDRLMKEARPKGARATERLRAQGTGRLLEGHQTKKGK